MSDIHWIFIGVGFVAGIFSSYLVHDLVFPVGEEN